MASFILRCRMVFFSWRFLLNLLLVLVITSWIPLLAQTYTLKDSNGVVLQEQTVKVRAWTSWRKMMKPGAPDFKSHLYAVSTHFGVCLLISFSVWFVTRRQLQKKMLRTEHTGGDPDSFNTPPEKGEDHD
ncbi:MAG TPA: hypothetical protein PK480_05445 [Candidatus Hydrogenedentes bacterium]|nr:hypothetical protein [Candidatus Hydrogenedentota bacterium]